MIPTEYLFGFAHVVGSAGLLFLYHGVQRGPFSDSEMTSVGTGVVRKAMPFEGHLANLFTLNFLAFFPWTFIEQSLTFGPEDTRSFLLLSTWIIGISFLLIHQLRSRGAGTSAVQSALLWTLLVVLLAKPGMEAPTRGWVNPELAVWSTRILIFLALFTYSVGTIRESISGNQGRLDLTLSVFYSAALISHVLADLTIDFSNFTVWGTYLVGVLILLILSFCLHWMSRTLWTGRAWRRVCLVLMGGPITLSILTYY